MNRLWLKRDAAPCVEYTKLGLLKHTGHTTERLYVEDSQGNTYAIDISGRAYLSIIGSAWLTNHKDDLPLAFEALLAINADEVGERFYLPVLGVEGFSCTDGVNTQPLKAWYDTRLKRFYFHQSSDGQKPDYLIDDTYGQAALWDTHNKTLLYVSSMTLDEVQEFNTVIPENRLPPSEVVMHNVQKAWKTGTLLNLQNNHLRFSANFSGSPYHFLLQGLTEEYASPYVLSYQLTQALKAEFYAVFNHENLVYPRDTYISWETNLPNTVSVVQDLQAINLAERKSTLHKLLIEKIKGLQPGTSFLPRQMWSLLAARLAQILPQEKLEADDIANMIEGAFTEIKRSGSRRIVF